MKKFSYRCVKCSSEYPSCSDKEMLTCPSCGSNLDVIYDYGNIDITGPADIFDMFIYPQLLPVDVDRSLLRLPIGGTPLVQSRLLSNLFFKDDSRNPSLSYKDRASAIAVLRASELGLDTIVTASTGNAAASLSVLCAAAGLKAVIFVPESAPEGKLLQILMHGAQLVKVKGTYDQVFDMATEYSSYCGAYLRSTGINPMMAEGRKTSAFEIYEQFGRSVPDNIVVSVGDGCIIGGIYKGFWELKELGMINRIPRIIGVQAEGSSPLVKAFDNNSMEFTPESADTIADSISVGYPRDGYKALRAAYETQGVFISVSDTQIMQAQYDMSKNEGIFCEPAASAAYAGYLKLKPEGDTVVMVTGNGLKDPRSADRSNEFSFVTASFDNYSLEDISKGLNLPFI